MLSRRMKLAVSAMALAGMQLAAGGIALAQDDETFTIHLNSDIGGFDHIATPRGGMSRYQVLYAVHDLLFDYDIFTGELNPRLALSADPMDDFKTWRVALREGVEFSNGEALTTQAYVDHFDRLLASPLADEFRAEFGSNLQSVTAVDDYTMDFNFAETNVAFDVILGSPSYIWYLNAPGYAAEHQDDEDYNGQAVGAGPFMLEEWQPGHSITLVRNPNYWDADSIKAERLEFLISSGSESAILWPRLMAGDVDAAMTFGELVPRGIAGDGGLNFNLGVRQTLGQAVNFNLDIAPFDDIRVRRAMAHAIDRDTVVEIATRGGGRVADEGFEPESVWHCGNIEQPEYNPDLARELLADYGEPVQIEFFTRNVSSYLAISEILQEMWSDVGIEVDLVVEGSGPTSLVSRVNRGELGSWLLVIGQNLHPTVFNTEMHSDRSGNQWHIESASLDAAIDDLRAARTFDEIYEAHCTFEQAKADELPYIPLLYGMLSTFSQADVVGLPAPRSVFAGFNTMYREE